MKALLKLAPPVAEGLPEKIAEGFAALLGERPDFEIVEDPTLLGGFMAMIDGKAYDASFSSLLESLGAGLREEEERDG